MHAFAHDSAEAEHLQHNHEQQDQERALEAARDELAQIVGADAHRGGAFGTAGAAALRRQDEVHDRPPHLSLFTSTQQGGDRSSSASPFRFATTTGAFGLATPHHPSTPTGPTSPTAATSPSTTGAARRLRRPSLLSLKPREPQDVSLSPKSITASLPATTESQRLPPVPPSTPAPLQPPATPAPQGRPWGITPLTAITAPERVASAPPIPIEGLTTSTSPVPGVAGGRRGSESEASGAQSPMAMDTEDQLRSPLKWLPPHMQPRRSKDKSQIIEDDQAAPVARMPFTGRPLPGPLLATLISESAPLEHEMRSEARLQRLLFSHPSALPFNPRQRRNTRWTRGRFPEMVGDDDDDDDDDAARMALGARWRAGSSDSDSDDMMDDSSVQEWPAASSGAGAVNSAFASVMDLDRPSSSNSSGAWNSTSGKSTPSHGNGSGNGNGSTTTATRAGTSSATATPGVSTPGWKKPPVAPSPSTGLQLPTAFGGLAMGSGGGGAGTGNGIATPLGSPTVERSELGGSPGAMAIASPMSIASPGMSSIAASPGMMQYRDPPSIRTGKRKAAASDDRFDPYKRPRGSSPSPFQQNIAVSPSKSTGAMNAMSAVPIPSSPSHLPLVGSALAVTSPGYLSLGGGMGMGSHTRKPPTHPYTRPMSSRSRAASPALSIGSTSGVLSSSLGNGGLTGPSRPLAGPFIPSGPGSAAAVSAANAVGAAPRDLGGLGLLSLANQGGEGGGDAGTGGGGGAEGRMAQHAREVPSPQPDSENEAHDETLWEVEEDGEMAMDED